MRFRHALTSAFVLVAVAANAQNTLDPDNKCRGDGIVRPYPALREADVAWERRVWRVIDLADASNAPLSASNVEGTVCLSLMDVIPHGLRDEGGITAYDPGEHGTDDAFRVPLSRERLRMMLQALDTLPPSAIGRFMLKEDWILDKHRSEMEVRIIGLAPMIAVRGELGELMGYRPMFWLYYPECRQLLAWWVALRGADGVLTYEAILDQRRFRGSITKVSNVHDRGVTGTRTGIDALIESEALRERLMNLGFDLWHY